MNSFNFFLEELEVNQSLHGHTPEEILNIIKLHLTTCMQTVNKLQREPY